jgi:hypothetical protein
MRLFLSALSILIALLSNASLAQAGSDKPESNNFDPTFGSRTDKADGSAALTIGRRLPTAWDSRVGTDLNLAAPDGFTASDNILTRGAAPNQSSGAVWGNLTMPGVQPLGFDKTSIEARLDAGKDQGRLGATLSRSLPLDENFSVTLQNNYAVTQTLANAAAAPPYVPPSSIPGAAPLTAATTPSLSAGETLRLNLNPLGTALSAGAASSTTDPQWHSNLSVEQTLFGPLKLTTSVEDAGTNASKKSIKAGFKTVW